MSRPKWEKLQQAQYTFGPKNSRGFSVREEEKKKKKFV